MEPCSNLITQPLTASIAPSPLPTTSSLSLRPQRLPAAHAHTHAHAPGSLTQAYCARLSCGVSRSVLTTGAALFEAACNRVNNNNNSDLDINTRSTVKGQGQGFTCGGRAAEDIQWDSGCSDSNDAPDLISFGAEESEETSFESSSILNDDDSSMAQFPLELAAPELDLEQIESDYQ